MDSNTFESTIADSKEESIAKAIRLMQGNCAAKDHIHRPNISTAKILGRFVLWVCIIGLIVFLSIHVPKVFPLPAYIAHSFSVVFCLLILVLKFKAMVINAVLLYQKYAPEKMRRSCLFTPSCSEYMLLAVQKYGVVVGVYKGLCRLGRCHYPNGGEDYP